MGAIGASQHVENMILYGPDDERTKSIPEAWKINTSFFGSSISWKNIDPTCFQYTLGINSSLLDHLENELFDYSSAAHVAVNSIKGLALYRLDDYRPSVNQYSLLNPCENFLERNINHSKVKKEIKELLEDPDVQTHFPNIVNKFTSLLKAESGKGDDSEYLSGIKEDELLISDEEAETNLQSNSDDDGNDKGENDLLQSNKDL
jgi:hypothetical protein